MEAFTRLEMTEEQNRALIKQRRRAVAEVRGRQTWLGAWTPLVMMLASAAIATVIKLH